jgi:transposase-like protein
LGAQAQTTQEETPTGLPTQDLKTTVIPRQQLRALSQDDDVLRALVQTIVQEALEAEMEEALVRRPERAHRGHRSGSPWQQAEDARGHARAAGAAGSRGRFRTEVSAREQRSEKALLLCLTEKDVRGDSIREVRAVTEELCGHGFSASTVSTITVQLDTTLERFMRRLLTGPCLQELRWLYDRRDATEARTHPQG